MREASPQVRPKRYAKHASSLLGLVALLVAVAVFRGNRTTPKFWPRSNVLLITLDTTRRDHLSCYGYRHDTTPHLAALADRSLVFNHCIANSNWTLPSHASMLTGLYAASHGAHLHSGTKQVSTGQAAKSRTEVLHNYLDGAGVMAEACTTLAELLGRQGYRTGAIVANHPALQRAYQLDQGFEYYDDAAGAAPAPYRDATVIADRALEWLQQDRARPFFLFLNFMDPHAPYNAPPAYDTQFRRATAPQDRDASWKLEQELWSAMGYEMITNNRAMAPAGTEYFTGKYDGELAYVDEHVGRVLQWLRDTGLIDSTMVIVTSDHGEALGEHHILGHGFTLYEPEVQVPMIVKLPSEARRGEVDYGVQHIDVMPTVLDVLGLEGPQMHGRSMLQESERDLFVEQNVFAALAQVWPRFNRSQRAVYRDHWKLIQYSDGQQELYNLVEDPAELNNLASQRPREVARLQAALAEWKSSIKPLQPPKAPADLKPETSEQLRDLGYIQ